MTDSPHPARRALVTGAAGFIGSHLADTLLAAGWDVTGIDDLSSGRRENLPRDFPLKVADFRSPEALALVSDGDFDVVCHLAAQVDVRRSVADPIADAGVNILGTIQLLETVRALPAERRPRVVFSSTGGALYGGETVFPTPETAATNPDAPYGIGKLASEYYLAYYARIWGLDTAVVRFGNVYGPRQDPHGEAGVVAIFAGLLASGRPLTIYGSGEQTRDYVYVTDVAEAILAAATRPLPEPRQLTDRAFNVGTGVETSVLDLAERLARAAGVTPEIRHAPERPGEAPRSLLDPSRAAEVLGWRSSVGLDEGLRRTYEFVSSSRG